MNPLRSLLNRKRKRRKPDLPEDATTLCLVCQVIVSRLESQGTRLELFYHPKHIYEPYTVKALKGVKVIAFERASTRCGSVTAALEFITNSPPGSLKHDDTNVTASTGAYQSTPNIRRTWRNLVDPDTHLE